MAKVPCSLATLTVALATSFVSHAGVTFGPVRAQPGQSVRLTSKSEVSDGKVERDELGRTKHGTIRLLRERDLVFTFRDPLADGTRRGMVQVNQLETNSTIRLDGQNEATTDKSPLTGKMFALSKTPRNEWIFQLDGTVPQTRVAEEIKELKVYLDRTWFPNREVEAGESWEFDPAWVKMVVHKDLRHAQSIGTMRLRQIRHAIDKETAVIDITIRSSGSDIHSDGRETAATVDLKGTMYVNLRTNLDELVELSGTISTSSSTATTATRSTLPIKLKVAKCFVRGQEMP